MGFCFICDSKLDGECTRVCSSITPHSYVTYPEKIAELLGDDAVVIVTPTDHMCKKCNTFLTFIDKTENDLNLVKNAILSFIQKKYEILPHDHGVKDVNIINGHLEAEDQVEQGQRNVSSSLKIGVSPTVTTVAPVMPVQTASKLLKAQRQPSTQQEGANKMRVYKCAFCTFQSKELGHVRFHMRTHANKKEPEKPTQNQATVKALTTIPQQRKRIYRCKACSKFFDSRIDCLDHIQKDHNRLTPSTSNAEKGIEDSRPGTSKVMKPEPPKTQGNNPQAESPMDVDKNQQDNNKGTVDTDTMLNDYVLTEGSADVKQKEKIKNSHKDKTVKEAKSEIEPEPAHEKAAEEEEDTAMLGQEEIDQENPYSVKREHYEDNKNVKNDTEDLDIEKMLATIHNNNPNYNEDTQNKA